jgi:hypothetical protein
LTGSWRFAEPLEKARHRAGFFLDKTLESLTLAWLGLPDQVVPTTV